MPVPSTYSEATLGRYMVTILGATATALGWEDDNPQYMEAVSDALLLYGTTDIASITGAANVQKLRALARLAVWRAVAQTTTAHYAFTADGQSLNRQQIHEHAVAMLASAERDAAALGLDPAALVRVDRIQYVHDPYADLDDAARTLP